MGLNLEPYFTNFFLTIIRTSGLIIPRNTFIGRPKLFENTLRFIDKLTVFNYNAKLERSLLQTSPLHL